MMETNTLKRKLEDDVSAKRAKLDLDRLNLENLPDDVLYVILSFLDATSYYNLGLTSPRFRCLCEEDQYWNEIDARKKPMTLEKIKYCLDKIDYENTTTVLLSGCKRSDNILSLPNSVCLRKGHLKILALENQTIDGDKINLNSFPETLEELSLKRSFVLSGINFFKHTCLQMCLLRVLILDHCKWVTAENLLPLSRYRQLEILSLYMCTNLRSEISYTSLCWRYGFSSLVVLNIRFIGLGDQILKSMYKHPRLQEVYFQNYSTTYKKSCKQRKMDIENGAVMDDPAYLSDDDAPVDVFHKNSGQTGSYGAKDFELITPKGVSMYRYTRLRENVKKYTVNSVLYKDPYRECSCGFQERYDEILGSLNENEPKAGKSSPEDQPEGSQTNVMNIQYPGNPFSLVNSDLEELKKEATPENPSPFWMCVRKPINDFEISIYENVSPSLRSFLMNFKASMEHRKASEAGQAGPSCAHADHSPRADDEPLVGTCEEDVGYFGGFPKPRVCFVRCRRVNDRVVDPANFELNGDLVLIGAHHNDKSPVDVRKLSFRGHRTVNDACLDALAHLKLDFLDVAGTGVTNRGLRAFMLANPQCRLAHEKACTCEPLLHF